MDLGIQGKWALVCAASKGLGKGCAQALVGEGVNRGFAAGVNLGVAASTADRFLIINPDAILQPGIADPKLMVVPDLLLVGPDGVVLRHWRGALSKQGQRDVSRALSDRF